MSCGAPGGVLKRKRAFGRSWGLLGEAWTSVNRDVSVLVGSVIVTDAPV